MPPCVLPLFAVLRAPLATRDQCPAAPTVRGHPRLFACLLYGNAGSIENAGIRESSRMTPVEGADWLGIRNLFIGTQNYARSRAL